MNRSFYKIVNNISNILINIFLVCTLLVSLYVCTYVFDGTIKYILFIVLIVFVALLLFAFKDKVNNLISKYFVLIRSLSKKQMIKIIIIILCLEKIIYSLLLYFDPAKTNDVISEYDRLVNNFINNGVLSKTIGDKYVLLSIFLSIFNVLHIPYHIGMFLLISISLLLLFNAFDTYVERTKLFTAIILYSLMPSTTLLSFCPCLEIYLLFFVSLFLLIINRLINNDENNKLMLTLALFIVVLITRLISYVGYIFMLVISLIVLLSDIKNKQRYYLTAVLIASVVVSNLFIYGISYQWRNKEFIYHSLLNGSNINSNGTFENNYAYNFTKDITWIVEKQQDEAHAIQEEIYKNELINNYNTLIAKPDILIKLLINKHYINFSGNHYSVEMLNNTKDVSDSTFYSLLGTNQLLYILTILIGLLNTKNRDRGLIVTLTELLLLGVVFVSIFAEALNKYTLFITPLLFIICLNRYNNKEI